MHSIQVLTLASLGALGCGSGDISGYRPPVHAPDAAMESPDVVMESPDVVMESPDVVMESPDVVAPTPDVVVPPPMDVVVPTPDVVVPRPDVVTPPVDVVMPRPDVVMPPVDVPRPSTCVSGTRWTRGNNGSPLMNPGQACVACHVRESEGPEIIGGTAYYQDHEENNCNGFRGANSTTMGAWVEATDASGRTFRMAINQAGNFFYDSRTAVRFPLRGVVVVGPTGMRNEMSSDVPHGDCNACHTQMGTTTVAGADPAPGRIVVLP